MSIVEADIVLSKKLPYDQSLIERSLAKLGKVIVLKTSWYKDVMDELESSALSYFESNGVPIDKIEVLDVPGTLELPLSFKMVLSEMQNVDLVVLLGCVVKGGTPHFDIICQSVFDQVLETQNEYLVPSGVGVLTVNTLEQARQRKNKGAEAAQAALEMFLFKNKIKSESRV
jgi:6,7-dimethyl-8-ribityllumazine synthase